MVAFLYSHLGMWITTLLFLAIDGYLWCALSTEFNRYQDFKAGYPTWRKIVYVIIFMLVMVGTLQDVRTLGTLISNLFA